MTWALESLKKFHFNSLLLSKVYIFWTKNYREVIFHDIEEWCKIWKKKMTCCLEIDGILLPKVENSRPQNLQRSYVSWQWRMIQKLKRNWLVVLKLTWGTSQILTRAFESLKNLSFNWLLVTKVYIVWATKVQRSYLSWHWRDMQILKKNWLVVWKKTWEIWQIFTRALS